MLIFVKAPYLARITSRQKTSTIRPWRTCTLTVGSRLLFNGKYPVTLTAVEHRRLGDLDDTDAIADGFASRRALRAALRAHFPHLTLASLVWVLRFRYGGRATPHLPPL